MRRLAAMLCLVMLTAPLAGAAGWWFPTQGTWFETQKLTPDDADEPGDLGNPSHWGVTFGSEIAIDGDTAVIGTQWDAYDDAWKTEDGSDWAYVFHRGDDDTWTQVAKLIPDDAHNGVQNGGPGSDTFAYSLDIDEEGGVIVAGNPAAQKLYIFERTPDGTWTQTANHTCEGDHCPEEPRCHCFAYTVAVSDNKIAAGGLGKVTILEKQNGTWSQTDLLSGGIYLSLEGDTLVAQGAPSLGGWHVYSVYSRMEAGWDRTDLFDPAGPLSEGDAIPGQVDISENEQTLVVGTPTDRRILGLDHATFPAVSSVGSAWIFQFADGEWHGTAELHNPDPSRRELFGVSVAASADRVVVGAPGDAHNGGPWTGATYVYEEGEDGWLLTAKLRSHDASEGDSFGESVGISGSTIIVGAPFDDNRRDGTPFPLDDEGNLPPTACWFTGCTGWNEGASAGSAYVFAEADQSSGITPVGAR